MNFSTTCSWIILACTGTRAAISKFQAAIPSAERGIRYIAVMEVASERQSQGEVQSGSRLESSMATQHTQFIAHGQLKLHHMCTPA